MSITIDAWTIVVLHYVPHGLGLWTISGVASNNRDNLQCVFMYRTNPCFVKKHNPYYYLETVSCRGC